MTGWIDIKKDPTHITSEKSKARALRKTQWWKNEIAKGICHYCGKRFTAVELTMDHVVPLARGGKSTKGNVVPCCKKCNTEKKYFTPVEITLKRLNKNRKSDTETK